MKVASILPQNLLHLIQDDNYHMCLAHLIGALGMDVYTDFYRNIGYQKDKYLIMDNGLIEGDPRPIEELVEKAILVKADELILPDVFLKYKETTKAVDGALGFIKSHDVRMNLMAVAQGETLTEWFECAKELIAMGIKCIGVPKVLTKVGGRDARLQVLMALAYSGVDLKGVEFHLLGCWNSALEVIVMDSASRNKGNMLPNIRGVDSALPYVYARADLMISEDDRPDSAPINFKEDKVIDQRLLEFNINAWRGAGGADRDKALVAIEGELGNPYLNGKIASDRVHLSSEIEQIIQAGVKLLK